MCRQIVGCYAIVALLIASLSTGVMAIPVEKLQQASAAERLKPIQEVKPTEPELKPIPAKLKINRVAPIVNGRLSFASKQTLGAKINELKDLTRAQLEIELLDLYKRGFRSNAPVYQETSKHYREEFEEKLTEKTVLSGKDIHSDDADLDDVDPMIGDDIFAALLNESREILVGGLVYHYSMQGIFSSKPSEMATLYAHLQSLPAVDEKALAAKYSSTQSRGNVCQDGYTPKTIADGITHYLPKPCASKKLTAPAPQLFDHAYIKPVEQETCKRPTARDRLALKNISGRQLAPSTNNCLSHTESTPSSNVSTHSDVDTGQAYLDTLGYCNTKNATLPFFGTVKKCISKFSKKHRVKTRFWDQDFYVYKSIGVEVKNQKKAALIWWTRSTDEMRLAIKNITFEYNLPVPDYRNMAAITYVYKNRIYDFGGYVNEFNFNGSTIANMPFTASDIDTVSVYIDLPKFVNYLPGGPKIDELNVDIFSHESVNKKILSTIWREAKQIGKQVDNRDIKKLVIAGITENKVIVTHMNEAHVKMNAKKISRVFDYQIGFKLVIRDNGGSGVSFTPDWIYDFYNYKNVSVDMYGLARSGKTWRGSKLKFED